MKVGVWNYYEQFNYNNYLFLTKNDLFACFTDLYINGIKNDILFTTLDTIVDYNEIDAFIF